MAIWKWFLDVVIVLTAIPVLFYLLIAILILWSEMIESISKMFK
jgi:hypothetical protein